MAHAIAFVAAVFAVVLTGALGQDPLHGGATLPDTIPSDQGTAAASAATAANPDAATTDDATTDTSDTTTDLPTADLPTLWDTATTDGGSSGTVSTTPAATSPPSSTSSSAASTAVQTPPPPPAGGGTTSGGTTGSGGTTSGGTTGSGGTTSGGTTGSGGTTSGGTTNGTGGSNPNGSLNPPAEAPIAGGGPVATAAQPTSSTAGVVVVTLLLPTPSPTTTSSSTSTTTTTTNTTTSTSSVVTTSSSTTAAATAPSTSTTKLTTDALISSTTQAASSSTVPPPPTPSFTPGRWTVSLECFGDTCNAALAGSGPISSGRLVVTDAVDSNFQISVPLPTVAHVAQHRLNVNVPIERTRRLSFTVRYTADVSVEELSAAPRSAVDAWDAVSYFVSTDRLSLEPRGATDIVAGDNATASASLFVDVSLSSADSRQSWNYRAASTEAAATRSYSSIDGSTFDASRHQSSACNVVPNATTACLGCATAKMVARLAQRYGLQVPSRNDIADFTSRFTSTQRHANSGDPTSLAWLEKQVNVLTTSKPEWLMSASATFIAPIGSTSARDACATISRQLASGCSVALSSWGRQVLPVVAVIPPDPAKNDTFCTLLFDEASADAVGMSIGFWDVATNAVFFPRAGYGVPAAFLLNVCIARANCRYQQFCSQFTNASGTFEMCRSRWACVGAAFGDPNYLLHNGSLQVCDTLGKNVLVSSAAATVMVEHVAVGSTTATAISGASITFHETGRTVFFSARDASTEISDDRVLVGSSGASDAAMNNFLRIERVSTTFGFFLNVQAIVATPTAGILVNGCPDATAVDESKVASIPECDAIRDPIYRRACAIDVARSGSTDFVEMSRSAEALKREVKPVAAPPASSADDGASTITSSTIAQATTPNILIAAVTVGVVAAVALAAALVYILRRRCLRASDADAPPKSTIYVVGSPTAEVVSSSSS